MKTPSLATIADRVPESVGDAVSAGRERASGAAAHAPDLSGVSESVGRAARRSADTVSDTVTDVVHELPGQIARIASSIAAVAPFVDPRPAPHRTRRWLGPVALVAVLVVLALWWKNRGPPTSTSTSTPARPVSAAPTPNPEPGAAN